MRSLLIAAAISVALSAAQAREPAQKVIVDTDGDSDYDDVVAVMTAAVSPELQLLGVVVTGKDGERRARTVAKALTIVGRDDVGVYVGEPPISPEPSFPYMSQFPKRLHQLWPHLEKWARHFEYQRPAESGVDFYLARLAQFPSEVSVIVTGPLSTLGRALQVADERGMGLSFRRAIRQVLFSGGDFDTAEYNVYSDVGAARLVFRSGVTVYQFGGEGKAKAYVSYDYRQRLWAAQTPATWALQDLYRLWQAGWDPESPFVPILYDPYPVAFLIDRERIGQFEPMAVDVDAQGHLVRTRGAPNAHVRVSGQGERVVEFVVKRLTSPLPPATNHLRALKRSAGSGARELSAAVDSVLQRLADGRGIGRAGQARLLDSLQPKVAALRRGRAHAEWHLQMAREFLLGESRPHPWKDPYTPRFIALSMPLYETWGVATRAAGLVARHRTVTATVIVLTGLAFGLAAQRLRASRRRSRKRNAKGAGHGDR
ncbi:MAG: nucleoside hydrolase [Candidatus Binatia bacterium]